MTNTTARCDHIVALIDACLAEVEASALPAAVTALFQIDSMTTAASATAWVEQAANAYQRSSWVAKRTSSTFEPMPSLA
jgi:hypothetical protein